MLSALARQTAARARGCSLQQQHRLQPPRCSTHTSFWLHVSRFVARGAFFIGDAMEQTADEMTVRAEERDKGRVNTAEDSSAWARRGEFMWLRSESHHWLTVSCKSLRFLTGSCGMFKVSEEFSRQLLQHWHVFFFFLISCFRVVEGERSAAFLLLHGFLMCSELDLKHELKISSDLLMWVAVQPNERICLAETWEQKLKNAWHACRPYFSIS